MVFHLAFNAGLRVWVVDEHDLAQVLLVALACPVEEAEGAIDVGLFCSEGTLFFSLWC